MGYQFYISIIHQLLAFIIKLQYTLVDIQVQLENAKKAEKDMLDTAVEMTDEMFAQIESLQQKVKLQDILLAAAKQNQIKKTSKNSDLPPSKDIAKNKRNYNNRKKTNRKPGGQHGHIGSTLDMNEKPHKVIPIIPKVCSNCGENLPANLKTFLDAKQEINLPPIEPIVVQYNRFQIICTKCGHVCKGQFPERLQAKVQYGPSVSTLASYMSVFQYTPYKRLQQFFETCFNLHLSTGTLCNMIKRTANKALGSYDNIKQFILNSDIVGADETIINVNGDNAYFWTWQNKLATFIASEKTRAKENIYKHFPNGFPFAVIISDRYAAHLSTPAPAHQICWIHLLRHLEYLQQKEDNHWIHKFYKLFDRAKALDLEKKVWNREHKKVKKLEFDMDKLLLIELDSSKFPDTEILRNSMIRNRNTLFTFLYFEGVPFHNNDAERAIRNAKVKIKISGHFKSGQQHYAIIRSVVDTLIKNELPIFDSLLQIELGNDLNFGFAS